MIGGALLGTGKYINGLIPTDTVYSQFDLPYSGVIDITVHQGNLITVRKDDVRVHRGVTATVDRVITNINGAIDAGVCVVHGDLVVMSAGVVRRYDGISNNSPAVLFSLSSWMSGMAFDGERFVIGRGDGPGTDRFIRTSISGSQIDTFYPNPPNVLTAGHKGYGVAWTGKYYVAHNYEHTRIYDVDLNEISSFKNDKRWLLAQAGRRAVRIRRDNGTTVQILENE